MKEVVLAGTGRVTKAGIANMVATLAQMYGQQGIRANSVGQARSGRR